MAKSVVGDLINFRGLVYSPLNENGVGCQKSSECKHAAIKELMEGISYGF